MKIGFADLFASNRYIKPDEDYPALSTTMAYTMSHLFPGEASAFLSLYDFDFDMCNQMDILVYLSSIAQDKLFIDIVDKVDIPVLVHLEGGQENISRWSYPDVVLALDIMDKGDIVICMDTRALEFVQSLTTTKVVWWTLPYPVKAVLEETGCVGDGAGEYDIVVPYGVGRGAHELRAGYISTVVAERIIQTVPGFHTAAIMNWTRHDDTEALDSAKEMARRLGCTSVDMFSSVPFPHFIKMLSKAKLGLALDRRRSAGRFALDCAVLRKPCILSNQPANGYQIYNGIRLHDPFDVDACLDTARLVADGRWKQGWLDLAYQRAESLDLEHKAKELEGIVCTL